MNLFFVSGQQEVDSARKKAKVVSEDEDIACDICKNTDEEDRMLLCDTCNKGIHSFQVFIILIILCFVFHHVFTFAYRIPHFLFEATSVMPPRRRMALR